MRAINPIQNEAAIRRQANMQLTATELFRDENKAKLRQLIEGRFSGALYVKFNCHGTSGPWLNGRGEPRFYDGILKPDHGTLQMPITYRHNFVQIKAEMLDDSSFPPALGNAIVKNLEDNDHNVAVKKALASGEKPTEELRPIRTLKWPDGTVVPWMEIGGRSQYDAFDMSQQPLAPAISGYDTVVTPDPTAVPTPGQVQSVFGAVPPEAARPEQGLQPAVT